MTAWATSRRGTTLRPQTDQTGGFGHLLDNALMELVLRSLKTEWIPTTGY
jgi:hypothetical protein